MIAGILCHKSCPSPPLSTPAPQILLLTLITCGTHRVRLSLGIALSVL